jgi:hypothetical protein
MTLKTNQAKLNWRQLLIHFIAFWFLIYAFQTISYLRNTTKFDLLQKLNHLNKTELSEYLKNNNTTEADLISYPYYSVLYGFLGLVVAFAVAVLISKKRKWFWINSLIVFIVMYVLWRNEALGWIYLKGIWLAPGRLFHSSFLYLLSNGIILLSVGLFFFFFKEFNAFINKGS